jgi:hypothetical protein
VGREIRVLVPDYEIRLFDVGARVHTILPSLEIRLFDPDYEIRLFDGGARVHTILPSFGIELFDENPRNSNRIKGLDPSELNKKRGVTLSSTKTETVPSEL